MVVNPITGTSLIEYGLQGTGKSCESDALPNDGFERVFSSAIDSVRGEKTQTEKASAADIAEIIKLEMLRNSLSTGQNNSEVTLAGPGRKIGFLLENADEYRNIPPCSGNDQELRVDADLNADGQVVAGLDGIINRASERYKVDAGLIKAVIKAESNFNPFAVSSAGAQGLMQLMPSTAQGLGVTNSFDPEQNVMAGTKFLKQMLNRYNGNINSALAAYNWGPGNFEKKGGILPRETREYLTRVKGYYSRYSA